MHPPLVLASQSPSRKALLARLGYDFTCSPQDIDETPEKNEKPHPYVRRLAYTKAQSAQKEFPEAIIVGADTVGYKQHSFLQKPQSPEEAFEVISKLSGTRHRIYTGMCVLHQERASIKTFVTRIKFRQISKEEIQCYIDSEQWKGFSAGYSLDTSALSFIKNINGSISSVMGLPLAELSTTLHSFGLKS